MSKFFITGGAGFVGSNLTDRLLALGHEVVVYDNFSTGKDLFLKEARSHKGFAQFHGDTLDVNSLTEAMAGCDFVFHFAANADVRFGLNHPRRDLDQNTFATFNVLEAMRANNVKRIGFASTGAIYGEATVIPTPEDAPFPIQTSLYAASKLAGEGLLQAYAHGFGMQCWIFRFVSMLGERYTHGHIFDFYKRLKENPQELTVLGDGQQRKSYIYIQDSVSAIVTAISKADDRVNIFNIGTEEHSSVKDNLQWIIEHLQLQPKIIYAGGDRGWVGDNPFIYLDIKRIQSLGWQPTTTIREGVIKTLDFLRANAKLLVRS